MEAVLRLAERHDAPKMRALRVRGDDAARRPQQEEAAGAVLDRPVVRGREARQKGVDAPGSHRPAQARDARHAEEGGDEADRLRAGEPGERAEGGAQRRAPGETPSGEGAPDHDSHTTTRL